MTGKKSFAESVSSSFWLLKISRMVRSAGLKVSMVFTMIIIVFHAQESVAQQERTHRRLNMHAAAEWINTLPTGTRMLLNPEFEFYIPKTKECLIREQRQNLDTLKMITKMNFLLGNRENPLSGGDLPVIAEAFSFEDERQYDAQYRILIKYAPVEKRRVYDYDIYFDAIELASHSVQTQEAIEGFRNGKYEYMVSELTPEGLTPIKTFRDLDGAYYYVYKRAK